jgi:molybdopterin-guanine dinucleotide biosynthesis protein A
LKRSAGKKRKKAKVGERFLRVSIVYIIYLIRRCQIEEASLPRLKAVTGIILSGGKSTRMGENKAFIPIDGVPIIERIHGLFQELFEEVIIVANEKHLYEKMPARIVADLLPNRGALGGLYTGLFFSSFHSAFCVACDMPFLNGRLIESLGRKTEGYDVVVPKTWDGLQPLHAYYSRGCIEPIRITLERDRYSILDFYPAVRVLVVDPIEIHRMDPEGESFVNINTREELFQIRGNKAGFCSE